MSFIRSECQGSGRRASLHHTAAGRPLYICSRGKETRQPLKQNLSLTSFSTPRCTNGRAFRGAETEECDRK
ncbi:hypothetical protein E2C01_051636 [Portunus trituberculatus]|uniref:Uncharacterized protein n=1 Tax=Portunus trituberculatus TaxID=210409 RepID=A0A5B7GC68_PORTR|nr:hypothetical protein [Portunus trituberculatus]